MAAIAIGIGGNPDLTGHDMKNVLSLGAGVQSSVVALMSEHGELPPLDLAVFADTGAEPASVYRWLDWLEAQLSYPVRRVMLKQGLELAGGDRRVSAAGRKYVKCAVPLWTVVNGQPGGGLPRHCTLDYKIAPVARAIRSVEPRWRQKGVVVRQWLGISTDEAHRMKPSRRRYIENWWPLIERRMSRGACLQWMKEKGYPEPPRSSCVFCPYHSAAEWDRLQSEEPEEYERAAKYEDRMRAAFRDHSIGDVFVSKLGKPLREIDWRAIVDTGQMSLFGEWGNECEGMCGL